MHNPTFYRLVFSVVAIAVFGVTLTGVTPAKACTCATRGEHFFETVTIAQEKIENKQLLHPMTVILGTVEEYAPTEGDRPPTEMKLKVLGAVKLNNSIQENISSELWVRGGDGSSCMPYVTKFPIGNTYLFALLRNETQDIYFVSSCGHYSILFNPMPSADLGAPADE